MSNKYKEFMNYLHNELGITKEEVKTWTEDAITKVAQNHIEYHLRDNMLEKMVGKYLDKTLTERWGGNTVRQALANELAEKISISINE